MFAEAEELEDLATTARWNRVPGCVGSCVVPPRRWAFKPAARIPGPKMSSEAILIHQPQVRTATTTITSGAQARRLPRWRYRSFFVSWTTAFDTSV